MKRFVSLLMLIILCASLLVACKQPDMDVCPYCNSDIQKNTIFCSHCGSSLQTTSELETNTDAETDQNSSSNIINYTTLDSGRCNANIWWAIYSNGTLYIYGNGAIPSYEAFEYDGPIAPWLASPLVSEITDVIIGDNITGMGTHLFYRLKLNSLYLGKNVRVFDHYYRYFTAKTIYIPKCLKDPEFLLYEASADKNYTTVYYEGSPEEWNEAISGRVNDFRKVTVNYNYDYNLDPYAYW